MSAPLQQSAAGRCLLPWVGLLLLPLVAQAEPRLAYVKGEVIYTARAADGRDERRVCAGSRPCISHDGRSLAYTRGVGTPGPDYKETIVVRDLTSGKEADLPAGPRPDANGALWSPDDTWMAYNVWAGEHWQVAVAHPDGSAFHPLTDGLEDHEDSYFLAGWNLHDGAVLAHNGKRAAQIDPASGTVAWTRPLADLIGKSSANTAALFTISADGRMLIYARETDEQEIPALGVLSAMSTFLALADFPATGTLRRATPRGFTVDSVCVSLDGASVYLNGSRAKDMRPFQRQGVDGLHTKDRLYRYDLRSGKLVPLPVRDAGQFSVSRE